MGHIDKNVLLKLNLENPWDNFLYFTEERYSIFLKKEIGEPWPWTQDETLQKYRFTNLFREDDKTSRFIFVWVEGQNIKPMLANLIYARLCNKPETMLATGYILDGQRWQEPTTFINIIDSIGCGKTKSKVNVNAVWKGPYQVGGGFKRLGYPYREHLIIQHTPKKINALVDVVLAHKGDDLHPTLVALGDVWQWHMNMVFTQVLLDLSYLRSDIIPPNAWSPVLAGSEPVAIMLGMSDRELVKKAISIWNEKSKYRLRPFFPKDAEGALCEWRKYLCWKNGLSNPRRYERTVT